METEACPLRPLINKVSLIIKDLRVGVESLVTERNERETGRVNMFLNGGRDDDGSRGEGHEDDAREEKEENLLLEMTSKIELWQRLAHSLRVMMN